MGEGEVRAIGVAWPSWKNFCPGAVNFLFVFRRLLGQERPGGEVKAICAVRPFWKNFCPDAVNFLDL